jgi:DHA1 family bicyclomycin/chloramphenicol resistance-like MFS transporter
MPSMTADLHTDAATAQITISAYTLGFAFAQLAWGPVSDRYGRRPVLVAGLLVYFAASVGCWLARTVEVMILFRLLQALGACCTPVVARAMVRDIYELKDAARVLSYVSSAFALAPVIAPAVGALLDESFGWRANFLAMTAFGGLILVAVLLLLRETARPGRHPFGAAHAARGYAAVLSSRTFLGYGFTISLCFATIFVFNSVTPFYFIGTVGLSPTAFAIPYALIAVTYGIVAYVSARLTPRIGFERAIAGGLVICVAGAAILAALVFAGVSDVWLLCGAMAILTGGSGFVFPNGQAGAVSPFPERAGAASAMSGFLQMSLASLAGLAIMAIYDGSALPMALAVLAFMVASMMAFWLLILRHGR